MSTGKPAYRYLKIAVIVTVIISLFTQSVLNLGIGISYQLNKKYIAENLCENRNRPCMHCNGKCYLNKQLQNENSEQGKIPVRNFSNEESFISDLPVSYSFGFIPRAVSNTILPDNTESYFHAYFSAVFRPPLSA